jgi:hypothetical protein
MSEHNRRLSPEEVRQTSENIRLTRQFVRELLEDPERHEILPDDATVILLPPDEAPDRELTRANLDLAMRLSAGGGNPIVWKLGMPAMTGPRGFTSFPIIIEEQLAIRYERSRDVLTVMFATTDRPTMLLRHHPLVISLVEPETNRLIAYWIPNFLADVAPRSLAVFDLLLLSGTELIGITREEVLARRQAHGHDRPLPALGQTTVGAAVKELLLLSA